MPWTREITRSSNVKMALTSEQRETRGQQAQLKASQTHTLAGSVSIPVRLEAARAVSLSVQFLPFFADREFISPKQIGSSKFILKTCIQSCKSQTYRICTKIQSHCCPQVAYPKVKPNFGESIAPETQKVDIKSKTKKKIFFYPISWNTL